MPLQPSPGAHYGPPDTITEAWCTCIAPTDMHDKICGLNNLVDHPEELFGQDNMKIINRMMKRLIA